MPTPTLVRAATVLACLFLAGCYKNAAPPADAPRAVISDLAEGATPLAEMPPLTATHTISSAADSAITFTGYGKIAGEQSGRFEVFSGQVVYDAASPDTTQAEIKVDTASAKTDMEIITDNLKGRHFFEPDRHGEAIFRLTSFASSTATGILQLHGETKQVSFPATITQDGATLRISAQFLLNRRPFKLDYQLKGDRFIYDDVLVKIDVSAKPV